MTTNCNVITRKTHSSRKDYQAVHKYINRLLGSAKKCSVCAKEEGRIHWSNISKKYSRDPSDWISMCAACHYKEEKSGLPRNPNKNSSSRYKGVNRCKKTGMWRVVINYKKKTRALGSYKIEEDAAIVYNVAAQFIHGDNAILNNV